MYRVLSTGIVHGLVWCAHTCWKQQFFQLTNRCSSNVKIYLDFHLVATWGTRQRFFYYLACTKQILISQGLPNDFILYRCGLCTISLLMSIFVNVILIGLCSHLHPMKESVIPWFLREENCVRVLIWELSPLVCKHGEYSADSLPKWQTAECKSNAKHKTYAGRFLLNNEHGFN